MKNEEPLLLENEERLPPENQKGRVGAQGKGKLRKEKLKKEESAVEGSSATHEWGNAVE